MARGGMVKPWAKEEWYNESSKVSYWYASPQEEEFSRMQHELELRKKELINKERRQKQRLSEIEESFIKGATVPPHVFSAGNTNPSIRKVKTGEIIEQTVVKTSVEKLDDLLESHLGKGRKALSGVV